LAVKRLPVQSPPSSRASNNSFNPTAEVGPIHRDKPGAGVGLIQALGPKTLSTPMPKSSSLIALFTVAFLPTVQAAESLCSSTEHTFFSCPIANSVKIVSVCGAHNSSPTDGYLQYRFGLPGKIELEYPAEQKGSTEQFGWDGRSHPDVDDNWLWFRKGGYIYSVFYIEDREKHRGIPKVRTGVIIEKKSDEKWGKTLKCAQRATGDFTTLADIVQWGEVDD
jgi:hypothetical protein